MKIYVLALSLLLLAAPCVAAPYPDLGGVIMVAATDGGQKDGKPASKIVIKGKGGKVTDVKKKPRKKNDHK